MELIVLFSFITTCLQISQTLGAVIGGPVGMKGLLAKDTNDPVATRKHIERILNSNYNIPDEPTERTWKTPETSEPQAIDWRGNACYQPTGHHWQAYGYCEPTVHHWKREALYQPLAQHTINALYAQQALQNWNNIAYNNHVTDAWKRYVPNQPIAQNLAYMYNQPVAEYWKAVYNQPIVKGWNGVSEAGELRQPLVKQGNSNSPTKVVIYDNSVKYLGKIQNVKSKKQKVVQDEYDHGLGASLKTNAPNPSLVPDWMAGNSSRPFVERKMVKGDKKLIVQDDWKATNSNQPLVINSTDDDSKRVAVKTVDINNLNQPMVDINDWEAVDYDEFARSNMAEDSSQPSLYNVNENNQAQLLVDLDSKESNQKLSIDPKVDSPQESLVNSFMENDTGKPTARGWKSDYYTQPVTKGTNSDLVKQERIGSIAYLPDLTSSVASSSNFDQYSSPQSYDLEKIVDPVGSDTVYHNFIGDNASTNFAADRAAKADTLSGTYVGDSSDFIMAAASSNLKTVTIPEFHPQLAIDTISETLALPNIVTSPPASNISNDLTFPDAAATSGTKYMALENAPETPNVDSILESVMPAEISMNPTSGNILHSNILNYVSAPSASILSNTEKLVDETETPYNGNILGYMTLADGSTNSAAIDTSKIGSLVEVDKSPSETNTLEAITLPSDGKIPNQKLVDNAGISTSSRISNIVYLDETTPEIPTDGNTSDVDNIPNNSNILEIMTIPDNAEGPASRHKAPVFATTDAIAIPTANRVLETITVSDNAEFSDVGNTLDLLPVVHYAEVLPLSNTLKMVPVHGNAEVSFESNNLEVVTIPDNAEIPSSNNWQIVTFQDHAKIPVSSNYEQVVPVTDADKHPTKSQNSNSLTVPHTSTFPVASNTLEAAAIADNAEVAASINTSKVLKVFDNAEMHAGTKSMKYFTISDAPKFSADSTSRIMTISDNAEVSTSNNNSDVATVLYSTELPVVRNTVEHAILPHNPEILDSHKTWTVVNVPNDSELATASNTLESVAYTNAAEIPSYNSISDILTHTYGATAPGAGNTLEVANIEEIPADSKAPEGLTYPDAAKMLTATRRMKVVADSDSADIPVPENTSENIVIPYESLANNNSSEGMYFFKSAGVHVNSSPLEVVTFPDIKGSTNGNNILKESMMLDDISNTPKKSNIYNSESIVNSNISAASHTLEITSFPDTAKIPATSITSEVVTFPQPTALHSTTNTMDAMMQFDNAKTDVAKSSMLAHILPDATESDVGNNDFEPIMSGIIPEQLATRYNSNKEMFDNTRLLVTTDASKPRSFAENAAASNNLDVIAIPDSSKTYSANHVSNAVNIAKDAQIPDSSYISNDVSFSGVKMTAAHNILNTVNLGDAETSNLQQNRDDRTFHDNSDVAKTGIFNSVNLGDVTPPAMQQYSDPLTFTELSGIRNLKINNAVKFDAANTHVEKKSSEPSSFTDLTGMSNLYVNNAVNVGAAKIPALQKTSEPLISADNFVNSNRGIFNAVNINAAGSPTRLHITEPVSFKEHPESLPERKTEDTSFIKISEKSNLDISNAVTFDSAYGRHSPRSDSNAFALDDDTTRVQPFHSDADYLGRISNVVNFGFGAKTPGLRSNTDSGMFGNNPEIPHARISNTVDFHRANIPNYSNILNAVNIDAPARPSTPEYNVGDDLDRRSDIPTTGGDSKGFSVNGKGSTKHQISNTVAIGGVGSIPSSRTDIASIPSNDESSAGNQISNSVTFNNAIDNSFARYISNAVNLAGDVSSDHRISNSVTFGDVDQTPSGSHISETMALPNSPKKSFEDILYIPASKSSGKANTNHIAHTSNSLVQDYLASHKEEQIIGGNLNQLPEQGVNEEKSTKSDRPLLPRNEPLVSSVSHKRNLAMPNTAESLDAATPRHSKPTPKKNDILANTFGAITDNTIDNAKTVTLPPQQNGYFTYLPNAPDPTGQLNYHNVPSNQFRSSTSGTYFTHVCPLCWTRLHGWYAPQ